MSLLLPMRATETCSDGGRWSWWPVALTGVCTYAVLLGLYVVAHQGNPAALVCVDPGRVGTFPWEAAGVGLGKGYDGQFYYALARNPWRVHGGNELDSPIRHVRILYPALAWLLTGGDRVALFWALPLVNLLALGGLAALGAVVCSGRSLSPWWGLLLPAAVGGGLAALRDLTDVVSSCALAALLVGRLRDWHPSVVLLAAAAALFSREQNLVLVAGFFALTLWERHWWTALRLAGVMGLWASWIVTLRLGYGEWPVMPTQGNLTQPLGGLWYAWTHLGPFGHGRLGFLINLGCLLGLVSQVGLLAWFPRWRPDPALLLVALLGSVLMVSAGVSIYEDRWSFMRVLTWLPLALWLGYAQAGRRWALVALALPGLMPVYEVLHALRHA
jgi:hypothetical protein